MKQTKKLIACLLVLALALVSVGCGSSKEQTAATKLEETEANASESIGAGKDESTELNSSDTKEDTEPAEEKERKDFQFIDQKIVFAEDHESKLTLIIAHHLDQVKSVEFSYQEILLDGIPAENWEAQGLGADTFTTEPGGCFPQTLVLAANIDDYSELTIQATANFDDGTEPYPFSVTYQISDLARSEGSNSSGQTQSGDPIVAFTSQDLYSANGLTVTIPEQTLKALYTDVEGRHYQEPLLHFENQSEDYLFIRFVDMSINGEATGISDAFGDDYYDAAPAAGETCDQCITLGDALLAAVDSGADSGEITLTLYISKDMETALDEAEITIPFTIAK